MVNKLKVALVGTGAMGKKYAEMIANGKTEKIKLSAIVVRREEQLEWAYSLVDSDGDIPQVFRSTQELFENESAFEAVLIVTPHKTHEEIAVKAFEMGKHVLCDKPAGITVGEARRMSESADKCGMIYGMVFHQRRYPKYIKLKEILDNHKIGDIKRVMLINSRYLRTSYYHSSGNWRSSWNGEGGGALINQGAHLLDIWQWLFGMPQKIYANIPFGKYNDFMVDDEVTISMKYSDNMSGVFVLTTGEAVWEEKLEIVGTKGKIVLEDDKMNIYKFDTDVSEYILSAKTNSRELIEIQEENIEFAKTEEPYCELLDNFACAVAENDEKLLIAPGREALNQLMLTNATYYSAWEGMPVHLPLDENEYEEAYLKRCADENKRK